MNKKSFFIGMLSGIVLTIAVLFIIGFVSQKNNEDDAIQRLEKPVSYENKKETSFKVFQVIREDAALAKVISVNANINIVAICEILAITTISCIDFTTTFLNDVVDS